MALWSVQLLSLVDTLTMSNGRKGPRGLHGRRHNLTPNGSFSGTARCSFRPLSPVVYRAFIWTLLRALPPPCVIFSPRRRPAVLVRLQTAAHRRLTSPVQEEQGATAPRDRARIVRFTVC